MSGACAPMALGDGLYACETGGGWVYAWTGEVGWRELGLFGRGCVCVSGVIGEDDGC